jgi:hypothetical protein
MDFTNDQVKQWQMLDERIPNTMLQSNGHWFISILYALLNFSRLKLKKNVRKELG